MIADRRKAAVVLALALTFAVASAAAATKEQSSTSFLPGASSKQPVSIEADKLVYFDKEQRAVYTGNVIVIQGDSKMTCSGLTIFMEKAGAPDAAPAKDAAKSGADSSSSHVKHLDAAGPVTVISKTQVATGDRASYDKAQNKVWLLGNVTLSDSGNVTKGDKLTYDLTTGQATVDTGAAGRVKGLFIPGSSAPGGDDKPGASK